MNRDTRRRQSRQARLTKNAEEAARRQGATPTPARTAVAAAPEPDPSLLDRARANWKTIMFAVGGVGLLIFAIWFFYLRPGVDTSDLNVQTFEDQGQAHLNAGDVNDDYNSNPPTSGPHAPSPVARGVYRPGLEPPVPTKEELVHNMEHGGVVIWYRPDALTPEQLDELTGQAASWLTNGRKKVVVVPSDTLPEGTNVAVTNWTQSMSLDAYDLDKISRYVDAYEGPGPENIGFTGPVVLPPGY